MMNNFTDFSSPAAQAKQYGAPYAFAALETTSNPTRRAAFEEFVTVTAKDTLTMGELGPLKPTLWDVKYGPGLQNDIFDLDLAAGEILVKKAFAGFIEAKGELTPRADNAGARYSVSADRPVPGFNERAAVLPVELHDAPTLSYHYNGVVGRFQPFGAGERFTVSMNRITPAMSPDPAGRIIGGEHMVLTVAAFILL